MNLNLDEIVAKINGIDKYNSGQYHKDNRKEPKVSFKEVLQAKLEEEIDDRYYYDKFNLKENGIQFGSKEFKDYKNINKNNYFPPLEAPWEVRHAWRQVIETCQNEKRFNLRFLTILLWETMYDKNNDIKTNETSGYNTLCILLINKFKNTLEFKNDPSAEFYLKVLTDFNHFLNNPNSIKTIGLDQYI